MMHNIRAYLYNGIVVPEEVGQDHMHALFAESTLAAIHFPLDFFYHIACIWRAFLVLLKSVQLAWPYSAPYNCQEPCPTQLHFRAT